MKEREGERERAREVEFVSGEEEDGEDWKVHTKARL